MILGVVSDSHGHTATLEAAVRLLSDADLIVHLGDGASDWDSIPPILPCPLLQIRGNCDWACNYSETVVKTVENLKAMFTHGHRFSVKLGLDKLYWASLEREAALVCYGHTHIPRVDVHHGVCYVNPGSIASSRTCAKITVTEDGRIIPEILRIVP